MKDYFLRVKKVFKCEKLRKSFHTGHGLLHLGYFGAVWQEGHGLYAALGGSLLLFGVIQLLLGELE